MKFKKYSLLRKLTVEKTGYIRVDKYITYKEKDVRFVGIF